MSVAETSENSAKAEKTVGEKEAESNPTEEEKRIDIQIDELIKLFEDEKCSFDEKLRACIQIPTELEHTLMTRERANRLFSRMPLAMFELVFDPKKPEYLYVRPILMHILAFTVQCTSPEVFMKFKPLMENVVISVQPKDLKLLVKNTYHNDVAISVAFWVDKSGEGKYVYDTMRYVTGFFANQKKNLDVHQFLSSTRILINKIYHLASLEPPEFYDSRGWPYAILFVVRDLLRHSHEKFTKEMRNLLWDIISAMTKLSGMSWFNSDKTFTKLVIQMNHVEIQMALNDPEQIDQTAFGRHLRVLELYTSAICDGDMFGDDAMEVIPHTVGDSTRYILTFWVECFLQKIPLSDTVSMSIFNFATYLFVHDELALNETKIRKNIGLVFVDNAIRVLNHIEDMDHRSEIGQMFNDLLERLSEFETLDERVPIIFIMYLDKLRKNHTAVEWRARVNDCKCAIMDLRGRFDWYSKTTLAEARKMIGHFTGAQKKEMNSAIFDIFDELPLIK